MRQIWKLNLSFLGILILGSRQKNSLCFKRWICCCSIAQSSLTLCNSMDCGTPGYPVLHHLPELGWTHLHWVSDAIQPSHPLSSPSSPVFNLLQIQVFSNESVLRIRWLMYWGLSISPSKKIQDWFPLEMTGLISLHPRDSQESSSTPQFKSINSLMLSLLYGPTLTSIHDYWKNHAFD